MVKIETKAIERISILPPKDHRKIHRRFLLSQGQSCDRDWRRATLFGSCKAKDRARDDVLVKMGIKVLRFSDRDVFENVGGVMEGIWSCL